MSDAATLPPEARVRLIVGGNFTIDALGQGYEDILAAVRTDPASHLRAFEQLYLSGNVSRRDLTELFLPNFLSVISPMLPDQAHRVARLLADKMSEVAREQEAEFYENVDEAEAVEISRQRQQLDDRRYDLNQILRGG